MTDDRIEFRLKNTLDEIKDVEGRGTELITLFIPPDDNLQDWVARLSNEYSQADNIKSKRTRKNVQAALKRAKQIVQGYGHSPPEIGLVVFVGHVDGDTIKHAFDDLPAKIRQSNYICDDHFHTGPVEAIVAPDDSYGLIAVTRDKATIGLRIGDRIETVREIESHVMGKTKAGGQSAQRFARVREKQKHNHFVDTGKAANNAFLEADGEGLAVEGVLIGGTDITVDEFTDGDYLDYRVQEATLGTFNVAYGDETGLKQLVSKGQDVLQAHQQSEAKELMDRFFKALSSDDHHAAYGSDEVDRAIEYGAVDTLLLSERLDGDEVDDLAERAENIGADVQLIPPSFEQGEQLDDVFDGVAALLRYEI